MVSVNFSKNLPIKTLPYVQILLLVCVILFTIPPLIIDASLGYDLSWKLALHKAAIQGLVHGRDIVFTYGPLGFLNYPMFISRNLWLCSAAYTLLVYALTLFGLSLYIRKVKANLINTAVLVVVFISVFDSPESSSDWAVPLLVLVFSYLYVMGKKRLVLLVGMAFLYSVLPFIKFSYALMEISTAAVFLFVLVFDKRYKEIFIFLISGFLSFVAVSLLLLKTPGTVVMYLYNCANISGGYSAAMACYGDASELLVPALVGLSYIGLLFYNALKKKRAEFIFLALSLGLLFISFKRGFVRHDEYHVVSFYLMWMPVFALYYLKSFSGTKRVKYAVFLLILLMFYQYIEVSAVLEGYTGKPGPDRFKSLRISFNLLRGVGVEQQKQANKKSIGSKYSLNTETIKMLSGHTVDVFPWEVSITELYGFKWHPRPVFQSYVAYTAHLDSLNAKYISSDDAPEYILHHLATIDYRYAFFDEPATFRKMLLGYEFCARDGKFFVLRKKDSIDAGSEEYIHKTAVKFGEIIPLPEVDEGLLFANVHIEHNLAGRVLNFLFKPPIVYFGFFNNEQRVGEYRFICSNAQNGLFLSQHIGTTDEFCNVFKGDIEKNITRIIIGTKYPAFFKKEITVEFFKIVTDRQGNSDSGTAGRRGILK